MSRLEIRYEYVWAIHAFGVVDFDTFRAMYDDLGWIYE